jgi:predicted nucleotidyltransferase
MQDVLEELVRRIVAEVGPRRVVLFGSAARGEMQSGSDIDLLIVMPDSAHRRRTAQRLYGRAPGYVYRTALREGRELYAA